MLLVWLFDERYKLKIRQSIKRCKKMTFTLMNQSSVQLLSIQSTLSNQSSQRRI